MKGSKSKRQNYQRLLSCLQGRWVVAKVQKIQHCYPSSAAVERLFAVGFDILRSKRSSMTKENFEKFVLLRENKSV